MSDLEMTSTAVVLEAPERLGLARLELIPPTATDVVVDIHYSGISTGTERLLYTGRMPPFPGLGYPLVPGYESVGVVRAAGEASGRRVGETVFVPGATCYRTARGLFGGASARVVVPGARVTPCPGSQRQESERREPERRGAAPSPDAVLLALAATAYHVTSPVVSAPLPAGSGSAVAASAGSPAAHRLPSPELIVGHGVLGRLLARLARVTGGGTALPPTVWETDPDRRTGARGYRVIAPEDDTRRDYRVICDCSGDPTIVDRLVPHLAPGGEIVLAGFYHTPVSFAFPPAFMREARLRVAAEWKPADLAAVVALVEGGALALDGLVTHTAPATDAPAAYGTAFGDAACLKMVLDWRQLS